MSTTLVYDQDPSDLQVSDGLILNVKSPKVSSLTAADVDSVAFLGTAPWGKFNTRISIVSPDDQLAKIGPQGVGPYDLGTFVSAALNMGVSKISVARLGGGSQSAAILLIAGATHAIATLTGICEGSLVNTATATLTYSPTTPADQQQTTGNTQKVYTDLTISGPGIGTEIYKNLDGNVLNSGTYNIDGPTLGAAIIAAVNNGQANGQGPSKYWVASAGLSNPGAPVMNTANVVSTLGTDGATFSGSPAVTHNAAVLGQNTALPYTGMWALAGGISGAALAAPGANDFANLAVSMLAFAKKQNAHLCIAAPSGTSTTSMLALKTGMGITSANGQGDWSMTVFDGNWPSITDAVNGNITRYVDGAAMGAIRMALTKVPNSPANLPMPLITGTLRVNSQAQPNPYTDGEKIQLENAGVNYWDNETAGDVGFAIGHNKNSLGKSAKPSYTGNIAYGRVLQFTVKSFASPLLGSIVGLTQGFNSTTSGTRKKVSALANGFIQSQIKAGVYDDGSIAVCDLSNNSPGSGRLRVDLQINQRGVIDNVAVGVLSGLGVVSAINPAQVSPNK